MEIKEYISYVYQTVNPYVGIHSIEEILIKNEYVVVIENDNYIGILTPCDLIKRPHKIVIDCLTEKKHISSNDTLLSVLDKFDNNQCSALPVFHEDRFVGVIEKHDLINKLKQKINELYSKSIISQNLKSAFIHNLSHEIRTPLNGLLGFLDLVSNIKTKENIADEKQNNKIIRSCADRFLLVMNDLIDLSLINSGDNIKIFKENFKIEEIFSDLKEFFETSELILNKKTSIQYINPDISFNILSDRKKIKHILYHLIDNAVKFSNDGKVNFGYEKEDKNIVFFVINNGSQISEEIKDKIFEDFYKQSNFDNEFSDGIGIGLSIVKKLSELLGGKVDFKTNKTETTFYITLPLRLEMEVYI
jgi:signal transduction histidine kinase